MKFLILLAFLILAAIVIVVAYTIATQGTKGLEKFWRRRQRRTGLWSRMEIREGDYITVYVVEPGTEEEGRLLVEAEDPYTGEKIDCAYFGSEHFEDHLELLKSAADQRLVALNRDRKQLRR